MAEEDVTLIELDDGGSIEPDDLVFVSRYPSDKKIVAKNGITPEVIETAGPTLNVDLSTYSGNVLILNSGSSTEITLSNVLPKGKSVVIVTNGVCYIYHSDIVPFKKLSVACTYTLTADASGSAMVETSVDYFTRFDEFKKNIGIGKGALPSFSSGTNNIGIGDNALANQPHGDQNVAIGGDALSSNTYGNGNVAIGSRGLLNNTNGIENTAIGRSALASNTTANENVAIGSQSMQFNIYGIRNTAVGTKSLNNNILGDNNTAIGYEALRNNNSGIDNTAVGDNALSNLNGYNNCVGLGANAQVTAPDQIQLGKLGTSTFVYGSVQDRSDERDKAEIQDSVLGLDFIKSLRPVDFKWDYREAYHELVDIVETFIEEETVIHDDGTEEVIEVEWEEVVGKEIIEHEKDGSKVRNRFHHGFIAQEVRDCGYDFGGFQDHAINGGKDVLSIGYSEMIAPMVKAIQEQQATIEALTARLEALEAK